MAIADSVTAYQGPLAKTFGDLGALGYDGVELMTLNPGKLDWREVKETAEENNLSVVLVCTGEIFGQPGIELYTPPPVPTPGRPWRGQMEIIDFGRLPGGQCQYRRIRGQYCRELDREETIELAQNAFTELADYAAPKNVDIALETVTIMQTNFINTLAEGLPWWTVWTAPISG